MKRTRRAHRDELAGEQFGRWTVLNFSHKNERGELSWLCRCSCGTERAVKAGLLRNGQSQSCGCLHRERVSTHGATKTRTFRSWESMKQRCLNPDAPDYPRYGGRGIEICDRWIESFEAFFEDMGERPAEHTLDRIETNGNYTPGNCKWSTVVEQQRNRRVSKIITMGGLTLPLVEWAKAYGVEYSTALRRLNAGMPLEVVFGKPLRKRG